MVRTTLDSAFPMAIWWVPDLLQIYNDGWRRFLGSVTHPDSLLASADQTWPQIWPDVGPMVAQVMRTGVAVGGSEYLTWLERDGRLEETFLTFSFAPIRSSTGSVVGIHSIGSDTTSHVVGERRMRTLRELATSTAEAPTAAQVCENAATALGANPSDVPFALIYRVDTEGGQGHLVATTGVVPGSLGAPRIVRFAGRRSPDLGATGRCHALRGRRWFRPAG